MPFIGVVYLGVCLLFWSIQNNYIYEPEPKLQATPDRLGLKAEESFIHSGTGSESGDIHSWWMPGTSIDAPTMLYLHGNDKNVGYVRELEYAKMMQTQGYSVLMIDYRGYGKSSGGKPSEAKIYEDAESAWNYLVKQRNIRPNRIFIYGHSLGGAIAINLAIHHPEAAGIISESSFTTMADEVSVLGYGFMPTGILVHEKFDSLSKVPNLKIPLLIIHGTLDKVVPVQMGQKLFDAAGQPKTIKLVEGGGHEDSCMVNRRECEGIISLFVTQSLH